jgi:hypothetical protein
MRGARIRGPGILPLTMREPFVLGHADAKRWVIHPPQNPYGDGYVYTIATQLYDDGMTTSTTAKIDGLFAGSQFTTLSAYVQALADDWRGWDGIRT